MLVKAKERRIESRQLCNKPAQIQLATRQRIACHVFNISPSGALLAIEKESELPATFQVLIPEDLFQAQCEVRHRSGKLVGVQFTSHLAEAFSKYNAPRRTR